ncbi:YceI family protein [Pelagicoccus sp. SDUM812002]|uniref:YceI family protein n=1 Tax=Pelagicoccus sp. SDUM812002 TaxID=3041266 RepID=UPI00280D3A6C|nr:YceI family protein [Pelagicoccus sp. SDUM812002]MDQ8187238.1 YceI family protein [Pelagicoccus sp. SDUM812002]
MIPNIDSLSVTSSPNTDTISAALIDVRTPEAFTESHIPGAQNHCVFDSAFIESFSNTFPDKTISLVVYGESERCNAATVAAARLQEAGFSNVQVYTIGLRGWIDAGNPIISEQTPESSPEGIYQLNAEKSKVRWIGRNLINQHDGLIACQSGSLSIDASGTADSGELVVDMSRISCHDISDTKLASMLIGHLQSEDFFETKSYPTARFSLNRFFRDPSAHPGIPNATVEGMMQIRGQSHPLHLDCTLAPIEDGYVLQTQFDVDRTLFGAVYGSGRFFERLGKHLVNDLVTVQVTAFFEK